jgi:ubiquinone biosynthesis protein Coq4
MSTIYIIQSGNHYATLTDITSIPALMKIQQKMRNDPVGQLILSEKPRVKNSIVEKIAHLP